VSAADLIAIFRALAVVPIVWAIAAGERSVALAIFVLAAASDALDGWLARRCGGATPRGAFIDPLADKVLVVGTLVALTAVGTGWPVTVITLLVTLREGIVALVRMRALARGIAVPAGRLAKMKTAVQMVGVALIIVGERPWSVAGATLVGLAFLLSLVSLPRYFATRPV
jgi:CDP-diacylglycerol--glycerol-3-phosphate 3-phosphatidyltransferase